MSRKGTLNDAWTGWLGAYAGRHAHRVHDHVHTLVLGREFLLNVAHEPEPPARLVIFSTPGSVHTTMPERDGAPPDQVEANGARSRVSVDPVDGTVLLSRSLFVDMLDEAALHSELARHATIHLLWAALLQNPSKPAGSGTRDLPANWMTQRA